MTSASVRRAAGAFAAADLADVAALGLGARGVAGFADFAPTRWAAFFTGFFVGMDQAYAFRGACVASASRERSHCAQVVMGRVHEHPRRTEQAGFSPAGEGGFG